MVSADPAADAKIAGLQFFPDIKPGIRRIRSGRGFRYLDPSDKHVRDEAVLARIRAIVIPPAWIDVWICPSPDGHLQATGRDARGRKQYRYHACWSETRDENKFARLPAFANALPAIRAQVSSDLRKHGIPREKVLATVVRLLETTYMRVGNETYARENASFGLTTLRDRHVKVEGSTMRFRFTGKSGKEHAFAISDPALAKIVKRSQDLPGQTLFQYEDDDGSISEITSADVNAYLKEITGEDFTAKDFRTWAGTVLAAQALLTLPTPESETEIVRQIVSAIDEAAECLGNTRAVCRSAYIHPAILEAYRTGELHDLAKKAKRWTSGNGVDLDPEEKLVLRILEIARD
ncbi:DNA topoisomerase IB [soil metagenome]